MTRIAVTGADGYIGRRVVARLPVGEVVRLSRRKPADASLAWAPFDLGDTAPVLPANVSAVIHLAADVGLTLAPDRELANLRGLLAAAKATGAKFVFVSSQSAKSPRGAYGERKAAAEALVRAAGGSIVRPGLVIGGRNPKGLAAQIITLSRMPVLPDFGRVARVQAIHVEDLAEALVAVARQPSAGLLEFANSAMTLRELIVLVARRLRAGSPVFVSIPVFITRMVAGSARQGPRASLRQMLGLQVMHDTMHQLGLSHCDVSLAAFPSNRPLRRALLIEGKTLLKAAGLKNPPSMMIRRYVRLVERDLVPRAVDLAPIRRLGSAAVAGRRDRPDLDELRRRLELAVTLFECSPRGAVAAMRFHRRSWIGTFFGLGLLVPAAIVDVVRIGLVPLVSGQK